jgi:hypothetical protein
MNRMTASFAAATALAVAACGGYAAPNEHMASSQAAARAAMEVGAKDSPQASLHLKLAQEEIAQAQKLMNDGDNKRADYVLTRAKADAELAVALAREAAAQQDAARLGDTLKSAQGGEK